MPVGELIDALWSADPPATAVKTLQAHVSKLRRALGPGVVLTEQPGYLLALAADAVDISRFDRLLSEARRTARGGDVAQAVERYVQALGLWRGAPLPDLTDWAPARAEIGRLTELRHAAHEELLECRLELGEHTQAIPDLEAFVRAEPLRERAWALLLVALYRAGRQTDALRAYQKVRTLLVQEVGVEPSPMLRDLESAIIAQATVLELGAVRRVDHASVIRNGVGEQPHTGTTTCDDAPLPSSLTWVSRSLFPFAGRDTEMEALRTRWGRAVGELTRQGVLVGGEPGIGKTRLVGEAALEVRDRGGLVLFGRCDEGLGVPYQPFVEALRPVLLACPEPVLERVLGPLAGELTLFLPEFRSRLPQLEPAGAADADTERHRLFAAIGELIDNLSEHQPLLLVLDDLQWATTPTLLLLRHIITSTRPARVLIVGTYRRTELDRTHPLAGILADLRRQEHVQRITLDGLDEDAALSLARTAADHDLDHASRALVRRIHRECGGNPFFFWTILMDLVETGVIIRRDGRWTNDPAALDAPLPEGIREVVSRRLSSLSKDVDDLLHIAALVGRRFDFRLVAAVAGTSHDEALERLEAARAAAVVGDAPDAAYGEFVFSHDIIRRSLEEELSTTRRARLHWQIAEALEAAYADRADKPFDELARHRAEGALAGDPEVACDAVGRAGDAANEALAFEEAIAYYDFALGLVEPGDDDRLYRLSLAKGVALRRAGSTEFRATVLDAVAIARRQGDSGRFAEAVLLLHLNEDVKVTGADDPELRGLLREALEQAAVDNPVIRARLSSSLALTLALSEERERAVALSTQALTLARKGGDDSLLAQVMTDHIWVIAGPDQWAERTALAEEAAEVAERLGDHLISANAYNCLHQVRFEAGRLDDADRALRRGLHHVELLRRPMLSWSLHVHEASQVFVRGDVAELERWADELLAVGRKAGVDPAAALAVGARLLLAARFEQGRLDELRQPLEDLITEQPEVPWTVVLGVIAAETSKIDGTNSIVRRLRDHEPRRDVTWLVTMLLMTHIAVAAADRAWVSRLYGGLEPFAGRLSNDGAGSWGPVDLGLGRLAAALEEFEAAEHHFTSASNQCRDWKAPMWSAHTAYEHARMLLTREGDGDRARAVSLVDEAVAIASTTGQTRIVTGAAALM